MRDGQTNITIELVASKVTSHEASYELVKTMRASFVVLGPLCWRGPDARESRLPADARSVRAPSTCIFPGIPVARQQDPVPSRLRRGSRRKTPVGGRIWLSSPSVSATENILMAAVTARVPSVIENAAREPEVQDLARMLIGMGAKISGTGTHVIEVEGVERLHGAEHSHNLRSESRQKPMMAAASDHRWRS